MINGPIWDNKQVDPSPSRNDLVRAAPRCAFYVRTAVAGGFTYDRVHVRLPDGMSRQALAHPPAVGDLIALPGGVFRVAERCWHHSDYGSMDWPLIELHAKTGPLLDLIVDAADGPFLDQVVLDSGDDDE